MCEDIVTQCFPLSFDKVLHTTCLSLIYLANIFPMHDALAEIFYQIPLLLQRVLQPRRGISKRKTGPIYVIKNKVQDIK